MSEGLWKRSILVDRIMLKIAANSVFLFSLIITQACLAQSDTISVAVSNFENNTAIHSLEHLGRQVPELLKTELVQLQGLRVVERSKLDAAYQEIALSQSGIIDSANVQRVGRMIGAQFVYWRNQPHPRRAQDRCPHYPG